MSNNDAAKLLCTETCFAGYDCGNSHGGCVRPLPLCGTNTICPLARYNAYNNPTQKGESGFFILERLTLEDLVGLCQECEHRDDSQDTEEEISLESCFMTHCIDCPVQMCRDNILECEAEARMS